MTQLFINPLSKFTTDTLQTIPYATLSFFANNSSTPKAVYADKAKVTSLGTIVTADSAGIFPPIWLDGVYRATLKSKSTLIADNPATGVTQTGWPIDSVGDIVNYTAFSAWDATFTYNTTTNTFVTGPDGLYYQSITNPNFNKIPASNPTYWSQIFLITTFNATRTYATNEIVIYAGHLYRSKLDSNLNHTPPNVTWWEDVTFNNPYSGDFGVIGDVAAVDATFTGLMSASLGGSFGNSAQAGATVLDWYQEGTFTPTVSGTSTAGAATYTARIAGYTRIGNVVHVQIYVGWSAHTGTGNIKITGMPFTSSLSTYGYASFSATYSGLTVGAGKELSAMFLTDNSTEITLQASDPSGGASASVAMDGNVTNLFISGTYIVG